MTWSAIRSRGTRPGDDAPGRPVGQDPSSALGSWSADQHYVVKLPTEQSESTCGEAHRMSERAIEFELTFDIGSAAERALVATVGFVHAELIPPGSLATMPTACH